jgi:iron complex outermembrane receptor protein
MNRFSRSAALAGLVASLAPQPALAQEDDAVVVSATRAPRPSLEIPASVDRIHGDDVREGRAQVNLSESLGRVPGIVVQNRQNYSQDLQITSRGFGARSTFGVRGIKLIADGIPTSFPDGQGQAASFALGSARTIEVLRGPFSSLYGNSSGGVISVQTEDGPEVPAAEAQLLVGSYGTTRAAIKFGGQWRELNAVGELSRFNTAGYRDHSAAQRDQGNAKLRFRLTDDTSLTVVANSMRQFNAQDPGGLTRTLYEENPRQVVQGMIQFDTRKTVLQDQGGLTLNHRIDADSRLQATLYGGDRRVEQYLNIAVATQRAATHGGGVIALDQQFGGASLRYSRDGSLLGRPLKLSVGAERDRLQERRKGMINENGVAQGLKRDQDDFVTSTDLYAQAEWKTGERWTLHGGVRSSRVAFRVKDFFIVPGTVNGDDSGDRTYRATTPVAGVVFRLNPTTSLYANAGRGFETPTILELANSSAGSGINFGLNAATSRHFEVGAKTVLPRWARVNVAVFNIVTSNEIVVESNAGGRAIFKNAGKTDRQGFELGAETVSAGPWEARVAYTRLNATYRDPFTTVIGIGAVAPVNVPGGSLIPGIPRSQAYAEVRYRRESFWAGVEGLVKSRVAANDTNTEFADRFTTLNLTAGLIQQGGAWRFSEYVRVDNLTNRDYVGSVIVNETNGRYYEPSPRRSMSIGLQARLQF